MSDNYLSAAYHSRTVFRFKSNSKLTNINLMQAQPWLNARNVSRCHQVKISPEKQAQSPRRRACGTARRDEVNTGVFIKID